LAGGEARPYLLDQFGVERVASFRSVERDGRDAFRDVHEHDVRRRHASSCTYRRSGSSTWIPALPAPSSTSSVPLARRDSSDAKYTAAGATADGPRFNRS